MAGRFDGRVAFITGGSRGIGKSIVELFAEEGAKVAFIDLNEEALKATANELKEKGFEVFAKAADVTDREQVEGTMEEVVNTFGSIDILVNNAGVIRDNLLFKMTDSDWDTVMNVHLKGSFYCARAAQKYMVEKKYGRIVNISSTSALGNRGQANYATAKAGIQGFTKTLAIELGKFGITVNAVAPGFIETDMTKETARRIGVPFEQFVSARAANIPVGRSGKPFDIANAVAFFADERSSFVNGQVLYVTGGPKN
ncbi:MULTISPECIES: beta-ketoacyl-ACP reductase [Aeribacillus]|jgi:Dehydrogenases with different specificities (related to short-chain alcohol dehydrogenases)|uniref:Beta-ketoacyl-ACP reductase n=1 Tax=Aeribacillus composti TaxID=1868734 RepID=A0ABY9WME5_9BACI|nr:MULTISPECIES: beta-ketoacyl-ACP reductase [Aeribacillus]MDR9796084.1 beta-ketoacyl-ACP reductase [Aeribacillus pallidus]MED1440697.1 beta-ketoacyl-ACP reductase [Aeribacillus composti]RZI50472.1 beta-ketoacyl-ACP reductase [Aeribacillus pallidus]TVZ77002.1 3-oxoacyl-[acyl-carrier-protein] reductase [Aeribacillus composti]WNF34471.1 beta-ketoacyl-ACP reductase [Aeribacillus composti]